MSQYNVLVFITGSISAYKCCGLISNLVQSGHKVKVGLTYSAKNFIGPATIEGLTGEAPYVELFKNNGAMAHIELTRWADIFVICPATANTLNRLAHGSAEDLLGNLFLAYAPNKPLVFAPAMNTNMYNHPTVQSSITKLRSWGATILPTEIGTLACGEIGEGRLLHADAIERQIHLSMNRFPKRNPIKVLITSGGTKEPIDGVRHVANTSTGSTGSGLADSFALNGHSVILLRSLHSASPKCSVTTKTFLSFKDLEQLINTELENNHYDLVIHCAAVSDYSIEDIFLGGQESPITGKGKIDSSDALKIHFSKNNKLIDKIKKLSINKSIVLCAFKLTDTIDERIQDSKIKTLFSASNCDLLIHNDMNNIRNSKYLYAGYSKENNYPSKLDGHIDLACWIATRTFSIVDKIRPSDKKVAGGASYSKISKNKGDSLDDIMS